MAVCWVARSSVHPAAGPVHVLKQCIEEWAYSAYGMTAWKPSGARQLGGTPAPPLILPPLICR